MDRLSITKPIEINVPFLNYLGALKQRSGQGPIVRVGGNSQEHTALFFDPFPKYEIINKTNDTNPNNPVSQSRK